MKIQVLGSSAGGGFPQWNCNCSNCYGIRNGKISATPRTQSSIAVSTDNENWVLFNASPDIRTQLEQSPEIQPYKGLRDTGIKAVILVDSQIDHSGGLLSLREGFPLDLYTTNQVYQDLSSGFPMLSALQHWNGGMKWNPIELDGRPFAIDGLDDLQFTAVELDGMAAPYSSHSNGECHGDHIGLFIEDIKGTSSLFYAPSLASVNDELKPYFKTADCVIIDGTFWREDEMIQAGVGTALAGEMGHLPLFGADGIIEFLCQFSDTRKVLTHINNTNPILVNNSPERHLLRDEGIEVAYDGMTILLDNQQPVSQEQGVLKVAR